ncbi:MAG: hypothetical protein AB1758_10825 [Candidatus Eremiobacterota bacterium]
MTCREPAAKGAPRGLTLAETLVACAIFSLMLMVVIHVHQTGRDAARQEELAGDTYRAAMLAVEKLHGEFRGARVESVTLPDQKVITYWIPRMQNGVMQILPTGEPDWEPGEPSPPDPAVIQVDPAGWLVRDFQGQRRRLAFLGARGSAWFDLPTGSRVLTMRITAWHRNGQGRENRYEVTSRLFLGNQP